MDVRTLRAWWFERQGLGSPDGSLTPEEVLERTGWARSVGGVNPYLAFFARAGLRREQADQALRDQEIHELPSARGCTYVVPRADYPLALRAAQGFADEAQVSTAKRHLGVTEEELARLASGVLEVLAADGPLEPRKLRTELGDAVRDLGPEGKKRGLTSTLPLVLGRLQTSGRVRRIPLNGRLDNERYGYALWKPSPLESEHRSREEVFTDLARRYFRWTGPATPAHFQWFSGLGVRATKEALAPLGLVPLDEGSPYVLFQDDREALQAFRVAEEPRYALVGSIDGVLHLRRDPEALLDEEDRDRCRTLRGGFDDLPSHAILDRGRLIGLWEFDPAEGRIVWTAWASRTRELEETVARTEAFVRKDLGDARSFSLDSPEKRKPRLEALRAMGCG